MLIFVSLIIFRIKTTGEKLMDTINFEKKHIKEATEIALVNYEERIREYSANS